MGDWFHLSGKEREELLFSGRITILRTRVHWAKVYIKRAGLVEYPKRGQCSAMTYLLMMYFSYFARSRFHLFTKTMRTTR